MLFQSTAMRELEVPVDIHQLHNHYRHHRNLGNFTTFYRRHDDVRVLATIVQVGERAYRIQVATDVNPLYAVLERIAFMVSARSLSSSRTAGTAIRLGRLRSDMVRVERADSWRGFMARPVSQ